MAQAERKAGMSIAGSKKLEVFWFCVVLGGGQHEKRIEREEADSERVPVGQVKEFYFIFSGMGNHWSTVCMRPRVCEIGGWNKGESILQVTFTKPTMAAVWRKHHKGPRREYKQIC